jgi:hypothetical protein
MVETIYGDVAETCTCWNKSQECLGSCAEFIFENIRHRNNHRDPEERRLAANKPQSSDPAVAWQLTAILAVEAGLLRKWYGRS